MTRKDCFDKFKVTGLIINSFRILSALTQKRAHRSGGPASTFISILE